MSDQKEEEKDIEMQDNDDTPELQSSSQEPQQRRQQQRQRQQNIPRNPLASRQELQFVNTDTMGVNIRQSFQNFLENFKSEDKTRVYIDRLEFMETNQYNTLHVNWDHLRPTEDNDQDNFQDLCDHIQTEYYRFEPYLREAVKNFVRRHKPNFVKEPNSSSNEDKEFYVSMVNFPDISRLRDLKAKEIGQLCSVSGTVTRTSEVRPELVYGTFKCTECGTKIANVLQQFKYTEPTICTNQQCQNRKGFELIVSQSQFVDWQKIRLQENSTDIPPGSMPRSIDIIVREEQVEKCKPGDKGIFTGTLIVVPSIGSYYNSGTAQLSRRNESGSSGSMNQGVSGLKVLGVRDLNYKLVFLANHVTTSSLQFGTTDIREDTDKNDEENDNSDMINNLTEEEQQLLIKMSQDKHIYTNLAKSIAPNIYGHNDIKKGILLMLMGGVKKSTKDKVNLRGDINICIIGDPSTAKSQFLKYVTKILPRTIYTSGKASTSAGLTASVMRDPETGEFGIEAGALMLADNGIACIDEFDKMDAIDQAAIHEAMEQQTITITKAGIHATLNARASILAAANPMWGRYDKTKPLKYNVNLSAPIMSRFDLFFVLLDECDEETDSFIANHIVKLHAGKLGNQTKIAPYTVQQLQTYIKFVRTAFKPIITEESKKVIVSHYRKLRQRDQSEKTAYRFTVRQLESLIRLSEAIARVNKSSNINPIHVNEAARLLQMSIIPVDTPKINIDNPFSSQTFDNKENNQDNNITDKGDDDDDNNDNDKDDDEDDDDNDEDQNIEISFDKYIKITKAIVYHIRRTELSTNAGVKQSVLENIIIEEHKQMKSNDIKQLTQNLKIIQWIIHRLIETDHILIIKKDNKDSKERILMVHPNYDPDSNNTNALDHEEKEKSKKKTTTTTKTKTTDTDTEMTEKTTKKNKDKDDKKDEEEQTNKDDDDDIEMENID